VLLFVRSKTYPITPKNGTPITQSCVNRDACSVTSGLSQKKYGVGDGELGVSGVRAWQPTLFVLKMLIYDMVLEIRMKLSSQLLASRYSARGLWAVYPVRHATLGMKPE
jgi:hypothetical protein